MNNGYEIRDLVAAYSAYWQSKKLQACNIPRMPSLLGQPIVSMLQWLSASLQPVPNDACTVLRARCKSPHQGNVGLEQCQEAS